MEFDIFGDIIDIIKDQLNNIFESTLKSIKERHEIKGLFDELNEAIDNKIRDDDYETILSKGAFSQYIVNYKVICNIFEYVFSDSFNVKIPEEDYIITLTTKCAKYLEENGNNVSVCESKSIYDLFKNVLYRIKEFQEKIHPYEAIMFELRQHYILLKEIREKNRVDLASSLQSDMNENIKVKRKAYNHINEYIKKYNKEKMFWSNKQNQTLNNLYLCSNYVFPLDKPGVRNYDLEDLIKKYFYGELCDFLRVEHGIEKLGYGKTSLITKLSNDYRYINVTNLIKYKNLSFAEVIELLEIDKYPNETFILDGLEEIKDCDNEILEYFVALLYENRCKCIITCRTSLFIEAEIPHTLAISLCAFNREQVMHWLEKYKTINEEFDLQTWYNSLELMNNDLSNILFIPLILYMCVTRNVVINKLDIIAALFDILFNFKEGEIKYCTYNHSPMDVTKWSHLREIAKKCAIDYYKNNRNMLQTHEDIRDLYIHFGFIFTNNITFVHSSIWQYLIAEARYEQLSDFSNSDLNKEIWGRISSLVDSERKIDKEIIKFVIHFISKNNQIESFSNFAKNLLFDLPKSYNNSDDFVLGNIASVWGLFFNIFTEANRKANIDLKTLFKQSPPKSITVFKRFTLLTEKCPVDDFVGYSFDKINLDHANLSYSNMYGVLLRNASCRNTNFSFSRLVGAYANNSDFTVADFSYANLKIAEFSNSILYGANFKSANISGAIFENAILDKADFRGSLMTNTNFNGASLLYCSIDKKQMNYFGLDIIFDQFLNVYDGEQLLTRDEIIQSFKELAQVRFSFWSNGLSKPFVGIDLVETGLHIHGIFQHKNGFKLPYKIIQSVFVYVAQMPMSDFSFVILITIWTHEKTNSKW